MKLSINIENNEFNHHGKGIGNLEIPGSSEQDDINLLISGNVISDDAVVIDNISSGTPSNTQELIFSLQAELRQLKSEYQNDQREIDKIIAGLNPSMSLADIKNWIIKGINFLMQSTISGIVGNSAYTLLENILFH